MRSDIQTLTERIADHHSSHQGLVQNSDKELDGKLQGFLLAAEETSKSLVQQCKVNLSNELASQKSAISNQQAWVQSKIDTLKNAIPAKTTPVNSEQSPKWSDLTNIANSCKMAYNTSSEEINVLKENIDTLNNTIAALTSTHTKEPTPKWSDLEDVANCCKVANKTASEELSSLKESIRTVMMQQKPVSTPENHPGKKKLVLLTDSNGKRLDKMKFCRPIPLKDVKWEICYTLKDVTAALESLCDVEFDMLVICCGTNDIDRLPGNVVAEKLTQLIHKIKLERPFTKIILSETTPRQYTRDDEIIRCNQILHEQLDLTPNVFIADQSKLRDTTWSLYEDDKHVLRERINVYAGNIKAAMRKARSSSPNKSAPSHTASSAPSYTRDSKKNPHNTLTTLETRNNTSTELDNARPLMSCSVAPPVQTHLYRPQHPGSQSTTPPSTQRKSSPHMRGASPIGDRLLNISQNQHQPKENKLRDTLVAKLSDVLMCLQAW